MCECRLGVGGGEVTKKYCRTADGFQPSCDLCKHFVAREDVTLSQKASVEQED